MNFRCLICSDLFVASAEITTTPCGHLFHFSCLLQWLDRSRSCPQCRCKTTEKTIHRIFISVDDHISSINDVAALQNQIDTLTYQSKFKHAELDKIKEELKISNKEIVESLERNKVLEEQIRGLELAMRNTKQQTREFKWKTQECKQLQEEAKELKNKLHELEDVKMLLTGSKDEVTRMLEINNRNPGNLVMLINTFKKELIDSKDKMKRIQKMHDDAKSENHKSSRELLELSKQNALLLQQLEVHKNCERERKYLKKKIGELQSATVRAEDKPHNTTVDRILLESPVPLQKNKSPSVMEKVQAIKESDSPYLKVQSSSVGLSGLLNYQSSKKSSLFKQPTMKVSTLSRPSTFVSYDGLGGHSRDEHIPDTSSAHSNIRKRPKSSSSISSAKLRKLAPQRKLDAFLDLSQ